jgi:hypothetical protein
VGIAVIHLHTSVLSRSSRINEERDGSKGRETGFAGFKGQVAQVSRLHRFHRLGTKAEQVSRFQSFKVSQVRSKGGAGFKVSKFQGFTG